MFPCQGKCRRFESDYPLQDRCRSSSNWLEQQSPKLRVGRSNRSSGATSFHWPFWFAQSFAVFPQVFRQQSWQNHY